MPGVLDLTWRATAAQPTPPAGKAPAIYRDDTYTLVIQLWQDADKTIPLDVSAGTCAAQLRKARVGNNATPPAPLADFIVDDTDAATGVLVLTLDADVTKDLATTASATCYWDLQQSIGAVRTTWLAGTAKVLDDDTRV